MADQSSSGGDGPKPPAKNPFPIVVPKGDKHPQEGRVTRWFREFMPTPPTSAKGPGKEPGDKAGGGSGEKSESPAGPVQRATTQMLPGRLRPVDPGVLQQEIRFIQAPGPEQVVTLGWNIGEPPGHVTLNHSSIQPLHAKMTYKDGAWWMDNLAEHDPVVVNGVPMRPSNSPRMLKDGDRIRIGAVVFWFYFP